MDSADNLEGVARRRQPKWIGKLRAARLPVLPESFIVVACVSPMIRRNTTNGATPRRFFRSSNSLLHSQESQMIRPGFRLRLLLLLLPVCILAMAADKSSVRGKPTDSWPQWRGPHRDGISPDSGLMTLWPEAGPKLAWKATGLGMGFSGVSLASGRIFSMGDISEKQQIICLAQADGKQLWTTPVGEVWDPKGYGGPRCTPTIDGTLVFAVGAHGDLVCVEAATGKEVWRKSYSKDYQGKMHSGWGFSESPLVDGDRLICTPGGPGAVLVALDKRTGKEIWKSAMPNIGDRGGDGAAYSSIVVGECAGVKQYVQFVGRGVIGVRASDGKFLWGYNAIANNVANIPTPIVNGDHVFCSSGYGTGAALLKLSKEGDGVKADEVYFLSSKDLQNHHGGMIMLGDYIYCGHGHNAGAPSCVEWKTGKVVWRQNRGPGDGSAAVTYADGNLYFRYQNGVMALVGATPDGYEEKSKFEIPDVDGRRPSWPHPVIIGGKLYIREQDALLCYDVKAGP